MAYIGKLPATQGKDAGPALKIDDISGDFDGLTKVFDLKVNEESVDPHINNISIFLSGVHQVPGDSFSLSGSRIVFSAAPSASLDFHGAILGATRILVPDNATVETRAFTNDTIVSISGSLGANASTIRTLSSVTISGSFTAPSSSLASRITTAESELGNTLISSSAQIAQDISGSRDATSISGSRDAASISGSLGANASTIRTLSSTTVSGSLGANASTIRTLSATTISGSRDAASISGSFGNQRVGTTDNVKFNNITGSNNISASGNLSVTGNVDVDGTSNFAGNVTMQNDLSVTGRINAEEIHTTFISASITTTTGSNVFGDSTTDSHQFTGSVDVSGSLRVSDGDVTISDTLTATNIGAFTSTGAINFNSQAMTNVDINSGTINGITDLAVTDGGTGASTAAGAAENLGLGITDNVVFSAISGSTGEFTSNITGSGNLGADGDLYIGGKITGSGLAVFNDVVTITSTGLNAAPSLAIDNTSDSSYIHSAELLAANLGEGNNNIVVLGKEGSTKKSGFVGYKLVSDSASDNNLLVFGHFGTTELVSINGAGQMGVGTTTMDAHVNINSGTANAGLHVESTDSSANISLADNLGSAPVINIGGRLVFETGGTASTAASSGTESMTISGSLGSAGNVGIGTNNPLAPLHIHNNDCILRLSDANSDSLATATPHIAFYDRADSNELGLIGYLSTGDGILSFNNKNNASIDFRTNNTLAVTIDNAQNVGIGTDSPAEELHVDKDQNTLTRIKLENQTNGSSAQVQSNYVTNAGEFNVGLTSTAHSLSGAAIVLNTANTDMFIGTNNTERMRIKADGKIGIGFSSPETTLQVSGSIGSKLGAGGQIQLIRDEGNISDGDLLGMVQFGGEETDQQVGATVQAKCDATWATNDLPSRLEFLTTPDGAGDQILRMTIKNTGRIGIGTDAPDGQLDVVTDGGVAQVRIKSTGSGDDALIDLAGISGKDSQVRFYEATTFRWRIRHKADQSNRLEISNASDVGVQLSNGGNSFSSLSDERIKENLIEITGATEKLNQLRCVNYNYTFDKERPHLGLLAQEVEKFYPEIVSGDSSKEIEEIVNDDGTIDRKNVMSIEYSSLIPVLVKSVQELTKRIEELENK